MRTVRLLCVVTVVFLTAPLNALDIAAVGVGSLAMPSYSAGSTNLTTIPKIGLFGFGAIAGVYSLFPGFTIETGILTAPHKFSIDGGTNLSFIVTDTLALNFIEVPILIRFDLLPIISFGVGGYLGFANGTITRSSSVPNTADKTETFEDNNLNKTDFGLMASASVGMPILPMVKLLVDLRYLHGLVNLSKLTDGSNARIRDLQVFAGIKVSL
ncbi:MAG: PorT family protein [Deltaproteobacteria bacterium]|nr:PorT family protein [Deltaproteobacteria bacterium]